MTDIPQWAAEVRHKLVEAERELSGSAFPRADHLVTAFDRLIAKCMPEPDPVEALYDEILAAGGWTSAYQSKHEREAGIAALRRGMELAREVKP